MEDVNVCTSVMVHEEGRHDSHDQISKSGCGCMSCWTLDWVNENWQGGWICLSSNGWTCLPSLMCILWQMKLNTWWIRVSKQWNPCNSWCGFECCRCESPTMNILGDLIPLGQMTMLAIKLWKRFQLQDQTLTLFLLIVGHLLIFWTCWLRCVFLLRTAWASLAEIFWIQW